MNLIYTEAVTVDTAGINISLGTTGSSPGNGSIPNGIKVFDVTIWPTSASQSYLVKGTNGNSEWITVRAGEAFSLGGIGGYSTRDILRVKAATGSFELNIAVKGE
jgi:hypothetical protein